MFTRLPVKIVACLLTALSPASRLPAQEVAGGEEELIELDPIVVVAGKMRRPLSTIAAQVTVIQAADLRRGLAEDLDGILKYEPGLELETSGTRFGATGVNIRGIGGNRVAIEIDGLPARDQFVIGAYSNADRVLVEPDRIKRIEVLHGPASVMYGSKALGGVMAITTWDPADLLAAHSPPADRPGAGTLRGGYQGMNDSWVASGTAAVGEGPHGLMAAATHRSGHELDNQAPAGTPADPQAWDSADYLLRYTWDSAGGNRLRFTADRLERDVQTRLQSLLGYPPRFGSTTALRGDDKDTNRRLALDFDFSLADWQQGNLRVFDARHDTEQRTFEERAAAARPVSIDRQFYYSQDQSGLEGSVARELEWGGALHSLGVGGEWLRSDISELRDGLQTSLTDGSSTNLILGERMPVRDFPLSRTTETGAWLQDEISLAEGRWQVTPALRWDAYDLDPRPDAIWRADNPDTEVVAVEESRFTPRLGVLLRASEQWSVYGQYAEGFRAPPFQDANIGFDIPLFGFRAIPNPDLRSETSQGLEFGLRRLSAFARFSATLFHTDFDDFIESRVLIGRDPQSGDLLFQSRNIESARIYGADLRYTQDLSAWGGALQGWSLDLAAYWAEGENRASGAPLNSIAPPQAVAGITWTSADAAWDAGATLTHTAAKSAGDIDMSAEPRFGTPGWTTLDLAAGWRPLDRLELRAGLFNLTDETYWRWLDVANLAANDPMIPLLSRPGRSYSLSVHITF
ncbi:MAG: TonB-dependent hemoglobin/transferrin/lactoferrin family receptor [Lysobacterales bacterium]|nr:MAG: TonB-dependent hemoglobin/transferrin/lactoferrin family receptor [Xanthomonadales bacterium]